MVSATITDRGGSDQPRPEVGGHAEGLLLRLEMNRLGEGEGKKADQDAQS